MGLPGLDKVGRNYTANESKNYTSWKRSLDTEHAQELTEKWAVRAHFRWWTAKWTLGSGADGDGGGLWEVAFPHICYSG